MTRMREERKSQLGQILDLAVQDLKERYPERNAGWLEAAVWPMWVMLGHERHVVTAEEARGFLRRVVGDAWDAALELAENDDIDEYESMVRMHGIQEDCKACLGELEIVDAEETELKANKSPA